MGKFNLKEYVLESLEIKNLIIDLNLDFIIENLLEIYNNGNKLLICGNGGSAADAQHFAAELVGRYKLERRGLNAIALTTDTSILTAIGNDYGFENIFSRQVEALGKKGDILFLISTSGNSSDCIKAINKAKEVGIKTISLLGKSGGEMKRISDYSIVIPSNNTPRIQENHIFIIHSICEFLEKELFN